MAQLLVPALRQTGHKELASMVPTRVANLRIDCDQPHFLQFSKLQPAGTFRLEVIAAL